MVDQTAQNWFQPALPMANFQAMSDLNSEFVGATREAGKECMDNLIELQTDLMEFADQRIKEDTQGGVNAIQAKNLTDLVELQQSWVNKTIEQYTKQTEKWLELSQRMAQTAWSPMFAYEKQLAEEATKAQSAQNGQARAQKPAQKPSAANSKG